MRKLYIYFLLTLFFHNSSLGQTPDLKIQFDQIDKFLSSKYNRHTPGCVVGIIKNGKLLYNKGFGMANLDYETPMTPNSTINVMSLSKQFTAACIVLLIIDKKISLNDDIHKYIPEFSGFGQKITIEHLIRHTSGIRDYNDLVTISGSSAESISKRSDGLALVLRQKELNFTPGSHYSYSNSGYLLLSYIIERISGMSFEEFTRKKIFDPLEMDHSFFSDEPHMIIKNRAVSYGKNDEGNYFPYNLNDNRMGCAGLFTTVEDLYKWDQNFYTGKVGGEAFNELMLSRGQLDNGEDNEYAFGNIIDRHEGFKEIHHSGGLLGIRCKLSRFPSEKLSIIYLGNGSQEVNQELYPIASLLLVNKPLTFATSEHQNSIPLADKTELAKEEMEEHAGFFRLQEGNLLAYISANSKGFLEWEIINRNNKTRLYIESKTEFKTANGHTIHFFKHSPDSLLIITKTGKQMGGHRLKCVPEATLNIYTGIYYSEELQSKLELKKEGNCLTFEIGGVKIRQPVIAESNLLQFNHPLLGLVTIKFSANTGIENNFLLLSTDRTSNLKFIKR